MKALEVLEVHWFYRGFDWKSDRLLNRLSKFFVTGMGSIPKSVYTHLYDMYHISPVCCTNKKYFQKKICESSRQAPTKSNKKDWVVFPNHKKGHINEQKKTANFIGLIFYPTFIHLSKHLSSPPCLFCCHCKTRTVWFRLWHWCNASRPPKPPNSISLCLKATLFTREWTRAMAHMIHGSMVNTTSQSWHK